MPMTDLLREARRTLRSDWRFTSVAGALLAVTLGAAAAMFAAVQAVLLNPLGFADQERVVVLWQTDLRRALPVIEVAHGEAADWAARSRSFEEIAVFGSVNWPLPLADAGEPVSLSMSAVSAPFFSVLRVKPLIGRVFDRTDESGVRPRAAVISHALWTRRFGRDPAILRRVLRTASATGQPPDSIPIVGVLPAGFEFPRGAEVWLPAGPLVRAAATQFTRGDQAAAVRWLRMFFGVGRLRPDVSTVEAGRELTHILRTSDTQGGPEPPTHAIVTPVITFLVGPAEPVLWALLGGTMLLLLLACANVAGLQVSRAARRQRALAIRMAIGASRGRLIAQVVAETAIVTAVAGAAAIMIGLALQAGLIALAPMDVPRLPDVTSLNPHVLGFGVVAAFTTIGLSALWPIIAVSRLDATRVLAHAGGSAGDPGGRRVQRLVVATQVALAVTLLAGTVVFLRSIRALDEAALGFVPDRLLALSIASPTLEPARWDVAYAAFEDRVRALPGVDAAGSVYLRPLLGPIGLDNQPLFPGQVPTDPSTWGLNPHVNLQTVSPGYFGAMGIRLVQGRGFTAADTTAAPGVVIVSERAAARLWPNRNPIGQRLRDMSYRVETTGGAEPWQTVVGVVADVRYRGLTDVRLDLYVPAAQSNQRVQYLMIRTSGTSQLVSRAVRSAAHEVDTSFIVSNAIPMSDVVAGESAPWRFIYRVFVIFGTLALTLAVVGLGAVINLALATRHRELAIRAALGADRRNLTTVIFREALALVVVGSVVGTAAALALGRTIGSVLIGVAPYDPVSLAVAVVVTSTVGAACCWWSARRAADVAPDVVLRSN
jgi:putative ABC transport system permease protein